MVSWADVCGFALVFIMVIIFLILIFVPEARTGGVQ
jgi:hypothetical protein